MRTLATLGALALLVGCDSGPESTPGGGGPSRTPVAVTVSPAGSNLLRISQEQTYTASVRWSDNTETTEATTWRSDATMVATVDGSGRARAIDTGEATIEAVAQGLPGRLRLRVVPNYEGPWAGSGIVKTCRESGDWVGTDICRDTFAASARLVFGLSLVQDRDTLTGDLVIGDEDGPLTNGLIRSDGSATMAARMVIPADGTTLTLVFDPIEMQARGDTMTGRFSMTTTATGIGGQLVVDFDVPGLTRSFGLSSAGGETGALGDRIARRLLRRR